MTTIRLSTSIQAQLEKCFDISRDIDVHMLSAKGTREKAIAGKTSGLCELHDEITWEAVHFGVKQQLTVRITKFNRPYFFEDMMLQGAFKSMRHEHHFHELHGVTIMDDVFVYEVPFGLWGRLFDQLILRKYMTRFLETRNTIIQDLAENASH